MNALVAAFENSTSDLALTANGARTLSTSGSKCVDLFGTVGSPKNLDQFLDLFAQAYKEHKEIATRVALWGRDVRGGSGRRDTFRAVLKWLERNDFDVFERVAAKVPELGRWDDLLVVDTPAGREVAYGMIGRALAAGDRLCAKWMPRKATPKDLTALHLRQFLGLTPRQYRKVLARNTEVVESQMCAKNWAEIKYEHTPSVAAARYARAFKKQDGTRYQEFLDSLKKDPSKKINVGTLYPHDLYRTALQGGQAEYANEAWARLPNFIPEGIRLLPLVDTSGSMSSPASGQVSCMQVAVSLGLYIAERNTGPFKDRAINFNTKSEWIKTNPKDRLDKRLRDMQTSNWGGSTNLQSAFDLILDTAVKHNVDAKDMPTHLIIMSDMEFNSATGQGGYYSRSEQRTSENFSTIDNKYARAGYTRPSIIFWNLNARVGNSPVTMTETGTAMISGFSPSIMKTALSNKSVTPFETMMDTIGNDRYDVFGVDTKI